MQALKARGITLAKGDRRGHVAITPEGEVLSIARYTGKKTKEIEKRLGPSDALPSLQAAKAQLAKELSANFLRLRREAEELKRHDLAPLDQQRAAMVQAQRAERARLKTGQERRWTEETRLRVERFDKGLKGLWSRLSGKHAEVQRQNEREAYAAHARDRAQQQAVIDAQMRDRQALQTQIKIARERHAFLLRDLRADQQAAKQIERPEQAQKVSKTFTQEARPTSIDDRIQRLRKGERSQGRDRDMDRER
jgi:hypothetical protein